MVKSFISARQGVYAIGLRPILARQGYLFAFGRMVSDVARLDYVTTRTEAEALLLESNLIKAHKPRYNILLRDDKRFPDIRLTEDDQFPKLVKYRGLRKEPGRYFGPFASTAAVNRSLTALQQMFLLRVCSDSEFSRRIRPCMQYQIRRCSAPCTGAIPEQDYAGLVRQARDFLAGRSDAVRSAIQTSMDQASSERKYELAARFRDRLKALAQVTSGQHVNFQAIGDADVIAIAREHGVIGVQVFFLRAGQHNGSKTYFPRVARDTEIEEALGAFLGQFYARVIPPPAIYINRSAPEHDLLEAALTTRAERRVRIRVPKKGAGLQVVERAVENVRQALVRQVGERGIRRACLQELADRLGWDGAIERIEAYDNSHIQGKAPVGCLITFTEDGFERSAYRKFNIRGDGGAKGDDYAMMTEVLARRFADGSTLREALPMPDLILIDGGKGQLSAAQRVLANAQLEDRVAVLAIAKGPKRNAGGETLFFPGPDGVQACNLGTRSPLLYLLERIRDEVHRFAIGAHRDKRRRVDLHSRIDDLPGVGPVRRRALLRHFGSLDAVSRASPEDLAEVPGISGTLAEQVFVNLRNASGLDEVRTT